MLGPPWGQACEPGSASPQQSIHPHDPSSLRAPANPASYFDPRRTTALPARAARPPKHTFPPPREKIALEIPTFRFFKTWVLRWSRARKHPGTRPPVPRSNHSQNAVIRACVPERSRFSERFRAPKTGRNTFPPLNANRLRQPRNKAPLGDGAIRSPLCHEEIGMHSLATTHIPAIGGEPIALASVMRFSPSERPATIRAEAKRTHHREIPPRPTSGHELRGSPLQTQAGGCGPEDETAALCFSAVLTRSKTQMYGENG
jgi:hypothetical protein